ncbi:ribonucleotide reductase of class Ia (aerobic), beta subunit [Acidovorax phage ACP17]|uniref:ribonucleoside-diphosphate reductase n=1 Tax=Acidovorax phage ACP17 TaxID=2010329 RepID=A0A218M3A3_9CAUD|nr:ribonucleotide reductase of class Ia (aerobic), beta subunit [Acidovorax phage ACP17]ASD50518.1 ribonucleotide reductase of class Ia (aerobic), beta subunit [Acidovorax phage ACP17]
MSDTNLIFNKDMKAEEYGAMPLFFGPPPGLFDTIHRTYPKIWDFYKEMKSLDWDEQEFEKGFQRCQTDFETCDPTVSWMMKRTIAWQWEQDSVAARALGPVLAPFITAPEYWAAIQRVSDNEVIHAATYSEIVRISFPNPKEALAEILEVRESLQRMDTVTRALADLYEASHNWALRRIPYSQELYNKVFVGVATILMMERIQFMASFGITFTICAQQLFQAIGKAVSKIAQDELEVHVQLGKEVLAIEMATPRGQLALQQTKETLNRIFYEIIASEETWLDYMFAEGRELAGTNLKLMKQWVLFNAADPGVLLQLDMSKREWPKKNPMPHLEEWLNMNKIQGAAQEQELAAYKVNLTVDNLGDEVLDVDF